MVDAGATTWPSAASGGMNASELWEEAKRLGRKGKRFANDTVRPGIRSMGTGLGLIDYRKYLDAPNARVILSFVAPALVGAFLSFASDIATASSALDGTRVSSIGGTLKAAVVGGVVGQAWDWLDARSHRENQREKLTEAGLNPNDARLAWGAPIAGLGLLTSIVYKITRTPEAQQKINQIVWDDHQSAGWKKIFYAPLRALGSGFGIANRDKLKGNPGSGFAFVAPAFVGAYISGAADFFSAVSPLDGTTQSSMGKTLYGAIAGGMVGLIWDWKKAYDSGRAGTGLAWGAPLAGFALLINILYKISRMPEGSGRINDASHPPEVRDAIARDPSLRRNGGASGSKPPAETVPEGQMPLPGMEDGRPTSAVSQADLRPAAPSDDHPGVIISNQVASPAPGEATPEPSAPSPTPPGVSGTRPPTAGFPTSGAPQGTDRGPTITGGRPPPEFK